MSMLNNPKNDKTKTSSETKTMAEATLRKVDNGLKTIMGETKIVSGESEYYLKDYRWLIAIILILIIYSFVKTFYPNTTSTTIQA